MYKMNVKIARTDGQTDRNYRKASLLKSKKNIKHYNKSFDHYVTN